MFSALLEYALVNYALRAGHAYRTRMMLRKKYGHTHYTDEDDGGGDPMAGLMLDEEDERMMQQQQEQEFASANHVNSTRRRGKTTSSSSQDVEEAGYLFANHFGHLQSQQKQQQIRSSCHLHAEEEGRMAMNGKDGANPSNLLFVSTIQ